MAPFSVGVHTCQQRLKNKPESTVKGKDNAVECLRVLRAARSSATQACTSSINEVTGILVSDPDQVRSLFRALSRPWFNKGSVRPVASGW